MEKYRIKNMDCASCAARIEEGIRKLDDVRFVSVNFATSSVTLDAVSLDNVKQRIKEIEPGAELEAFSNGKPVITKDELTEYRWNIARAVTGLLLLTAGLMIAKTHPNDALQIARIMLLSAAYLVTGWKVIARAGRNLVQGQVFNEYFLMTIATFGAIAIGEMAEAVAVMLFYSVGEFLQDVSVGRSRKSIQSLLDLKPDYAYRHEKGRLVKVSPEQVSVGDLIAVKPGERIPVDGRVLDGISFVDTSPLTGESVPRKVKPGDEVLAGTINKNGSITVGATRTFAQSSLSGILELVENASARKAGTEKFITIFARYYTPAVVLAALLLAILPPLLFTGQTFSEWIYRALVVLVVSCPCALVISIPLGYFGGIGAASHRGILVKGSNYLDALTQIKTVVFDKTGTLTKGEFRVSEVHPADGFSQEEVMNYASLAEAHSNHPIAKSILEATKEKHLNAPSGNAEEIAGQGLKVEIDDKTIFAGNEKLMQKEGIFYKDLPQKGNTVVYIAVDKTFVGSIVISDSIKPGAAETIAALRQKGIQTTMLTGDNYSAAKVTAEKLYIDSFYAELMPADKVDHLEKIMSDGEGGKTAFTGDGINDAPVLARADVGIAMGALGSDAAIETADIVLMTDSPQKIVEALQIADKTRRIIWQNIIFALGVKIIFIALGVAGIASMWEAVFGDMGVALIAVFNAMRILKSA